MTNFLVESTISLIALLFFYYLLLENEKMHHFKRFYLLFAVLFSLVVPFITIEVVKEIETVFIPINYTEEIKSDSIILKEETINYNYIFFWCLYILVLLILLLRFLKNIYSFKKIIQNNEKVSCKNATLVLMEEKIIPHTFLNYIFINKESYLNRTIEKELYYHELIHVKQKHTYDILGIEFLKIIFWFNPMFYFYKKAIQLNHEFIADENVIKTYKNVTFYQSLLLNVNDNTAYYLASNFNYLVTKKRLIMMTKITSKKNVVLKKMAITPLILGLVFFLCFKTTLAQEKNKTKNEFSNNKVENVTAKEYYSKTDLEEYYKKTIFIIKNKEKDIIKECSFSELTENDKKTLDFYYRIAMKPVLKEKLSLTQFNDYKNSKKFAIWIDGKHVKNSKLNEFSERDFVCFYNSFVYKNARSKKFPQEYQVNLYTEDGFEKAFSKKDKIAQPAITLLKNGDSIKGIVF